MDGSYKNGGYADSEKETNLSTKINMKSLEVSHHFVLDN